MQQFSISGMTCAACSARVERAVGSLPQVESCAVNLLTASMTVEGPVSASAVVKAVKDAGYGAALKEDAAAAVPRRNEETVALLRRLLASIVFLLPLLYLSMGYAMWNWPLPNFMEHRPPLVGLVQLVLSAVVLVINRRFFTNGLKGLLRGAPTMDTLVALGSGASFGYSVWALLGMTVAFWRGDTAAAHLHGLYFESAAMIVTLITVGKLLESRAKGRTTDALQGLLALAPQTATVYVDGVERTVPAAQVQVGDVFLLRPGETVPVDGVVLEGVSAVNEAALTGESLPVDKTVEDNVAAASLNQTGFLRCRATRVGEDTSLSQIIRLVEQAAATKAPIARLADKVSAVFVPVVLGLAAVTAAGWLLAGQTVGYALTRGIAVLVISCPCALGLATPVAVTVSSGVGARHGVLFKTAAALEQTGRIKTVVLDKTGTLTQGQPQVTDILSLTDENELLTVAYALERCSEHPLARAVCDLAEERGTETLSVTEFAALPGHGLTANLDGEVLVGGNLEYVRTQAALEPAAEAWAAALAEEGKTPLFFSRGGRLLGIVAVADTLREDSPQAVQELKDLGLRVVMLTGDTPQTAAAIGRKAGIDEVIAGVLPDGKEAAVADLQRQGPVAMVGDGINDAPALTRADVGIAIGAGTDVAIDAADVVLTHSCLTHVAAAVRLSRATLRNIRQNLLWAFLYNTLGIPLAAGLFSRWPGWELSPMFGAAAMSLSSFCVVSNALRLNLFHFSPHKRSVTFLGDKEERLMEKVLKIEGMMCPHCEAHVKKALEALDGVAAAVADHKSGTATVTLTADVADEVLCRAVEEQGYKVL